MYRYWISNVAGLGTRKLPKLLEYFQTAEHIYVACDQAEESWPKEFQKERMLLEQAKRTWNPEGEWNRFLETGIGFVTLEDLKYPKKLRNIDDPPYALFYKGKLPDANKISVAIVGARQRSAYGESAARELANALAKYDIQVISGLARGIDSDAHKGCLERNGKTFGVLGCGVDVVYPQGNRYLYEKLIETGGGVISEFPLQTQALKMNFPRRNRIISGLSDVIVVVEARRKSGSLITADFAMEQGKEIFALPGRISDSLSEGCNQLINDGCGIITDVNSFLESLGIQTEQNSKEQFSEKILLEKEERLLYSLIDFTPIGIGALMQKTSLSFLDLMKNLEFLKAKNLIAEHPSNYFVRIKLT